MGGGVGNPPLDTLFGGVPVGPVGFSSDCLLQPARKTRTRANDDNFAIIDSSLLIPFVVVWVLAPIIPGFPRGWCGHPERRKRR